MGLAQIARTWFGGRGAPAGEPVRTQALVVVPPASDPGRGSEHARLQELFGLLRRVGTFIDREQIPVTVLLAGAPMHRLADGSRHYGAEIRYEPDPGALPETAARIARKAAGPAPAAVASGPGPIADAARRAGALHIRFTTFERALAAIAGPVRQEQAGAPRGRRNRPPREATAPSEPADAPPPQAPAKKKDLEVTPAPDSAVLDLIDPL